MQRLMLAALALASITAFACGGSGESAPVDGLTCGDGVVAGSEECDDGNTRAFDGCNAQCVIEVCGDGITHIDEECDGGADMVLGVGDVCRPGCLAPFCGDGIVDTGEVCDGEAGVVDGVCASDCKSRTCVLGDELPSLRAALELDACTGIVVPAGTFGAGGTITTSLDVRGEDGAVLDASGQQAITIALGATVTITNMVIQNGDAEQGGALRNQGTLIVEGVEFAGNVATGADGVAALGGAVHTTGDLTLRRCAFRDNAATGGQGAGVSRGGAIYQADGQTLVLDTTFERNVTRAVGDSLPEGGAVFVNRGAFEANSVTFIENQAVAELGGATGGAIAGANATFALQEVTLQQNAATSQTLATGGGITLNGGSLVSDVLLVAGNSVSAQAALGGGAEFIGARVTLGSGVVFERNTATSPASPPLARGGGMHIDHSEVTLDACAIEANALPGGGAGAGVYVIAANDQEATLVARSVSFVENRIEADGVRLAEGFGAALYVRASEGGAVASATLSSCELLDNVISLSGAETADAWGAGFLVDAAAGDAQASVLIEDSRIEGNRLEIVDSEFASARGAAGYVAAIYERASSEARLVGTTLADHSAQAIAESDAEAWGGALYVLASEDVANASLQLVNAALIGSSVTAEAPGAPDANVRLWGATLALYAVNGASTTASLHHATIVDSRVSSAENAQREGALVHLYSINDADVSLLLEDSLVAEFGGAPACGVRGDAASELAGANLADAPVSCAGGIQLPTTALRFVADAGPATGYALLERSAGTLEGACVDDAGERLLTDVRGASRPPAGPCDVGAYERP